jgi:thiol-disulfide isomerase/thioredoxin
MPRLPSLAPAVAFGLLLLPAPLVHAQVPPAPASMDPQAKAILDQSFAALTRLTGLSATITTTGSEQPEPQTLTLAFRRPDQAKATVAEKSGPVRQVVCDGKQITMLSVPDKKYTQEASPAEASIIPNVLGETGGLLPMMMARPEVLGQLLSRPGTAVVAGAADTLSGVPVDTITVMPPDKNGAKGRVTLAFGHDDHLLRQLTETATLTRNGKMQTFTHTETVIDLTPNPALTAADFAFTPPADAAKIAPQQEPPLYDPRLVPGARPFPIEAKDLAGRPLSLAQYGGKVVLMDFWATWCGPCVGEMPNVIAAYKKYHAQGFDVLGISLDQDHAALMAYLKQNKMPWRQVFDGKGWESAVPGHYGVRAIPFGLLIGRDGKIIAVGVRGPALAPAVEAALAEHIATHLGEPDKPPMRAPSR